jgi:hypothetical protein
MSLALASTLAITTFCKREQHSTTGTYSKLCAYVCVQERGGTAGFPSAKNEHV